ncbi:MAG: cytochrome c-type biogenesis protein [Ramlibacter sp.]
MPNERYLLRWLLGPQARRVRRTLRWTAALAAALAVGTAVLMALTPARARAGEAAPMAADPALEARVLAIAEELRCVVCQNETLAASQADLARDLRGQIRLQLQQGRTREEITGFMVDRYGTFVLYRPPLQAWTVLLWAGPFVLLLVAVAWIVRTARERQRAQGGLTDDELRRVQRLLDEGAGR